MNIIIMLLLISFLILIHELGHFMSARALGIKVDKFGFGLPFGPTLFKGKIGDTEILVHALLLGGYVAFPDDDTDSKEEKNPDDLFKNKPIWKRTIVVSAGVIANVICAFLIVVLTAAIWHKLPAGKYNITVEKITAPQSASVHYSGLKKGDRIVSIDGMTITSTDSLLKAINSKTPNTSVSIVVERAEVSGDTVRYTTQKVTVMLRERDWPDELPG